MNACGGMGKADSVLRMVLVVLGGTHVAGLAAMTLMGGRMVEGM